ncbi:hypothetical protein AN2799.2 [Aspergillus nidulans FGSC A4]|uniref:Tyrosinase copper-binding domain-containing protein n=1 Tax=Emericella nidulans (strain FGSC A4 / ATCC 38163 / CBS 112.46 / NRRL 194 / M139) TaxID=227321 RepID=Q5B9I1_EMENI|nr:hypothetical protein [Aspergillus nidulans FGSC A4]EAA63233.1 hypothetical protein AN2799.2 [Aspergillus nidulans FGSC A4]CBF83990.1 TPA: hypothetical protein ANIA_02799 [Aspergillus nidulans FGSC A4]|eukprot:XP_660403.1 hypothetical protein AN2799.2 [Aspergillus nidulans FGSC A4]
MALSATASATARSSSAGLEERASASYAIDGFFSEGCTEDRMTVRKEWRHLTGPQHQAFLDALQCLMEKPAQSGLTATTSRFSDLQALHRGMTNTAYADIIHHVNEQLDADSGNMWQSPMWGADAFGGNGTGSDISVTDGRFANMTLHIGPGDEDTEYCLRRAWDNENAIANANSTMLYMCNSYNTYLLAMMADIKSSPGDSVFFMHHMYVDRIWWLWQKQDPINRLYDISGPTLNHTANIEPAGGWQNATLHYELSSFGIMPNVTIAEVMSTQGGYLCYGVWQTQWVALIQRDSQPLYQRALAASSEPRLRPCNLDQTEAILIDLVNWRPDGAMGGTLQEPARLGDSSLPSPPVPSVGDRPCTGGTQVPAPRTGELTDRLGNAYFAGMKEELNVTGNQYQSFTTMWTMRNAKFRVASFFICSENIGSYMNFWLKSLNRYSVSQMNTYPTVTNAITILTSLLYGWTSDLFQIRYPIVFFSLTIRARSWSGFLTRVNEVCAGDSPERKIILGSTNSIAEGTGNRNRLELEAQNLELGPASARRFNLKRGLYVSIACWAG